MLPRNTPTITRHKETTDVINKTPTILLLIKVSSFCCCNIRVK